MAAAGPRWVLCDGASHREAPEDALRVGLGPGPWNPVSVDIEGLEDRMSGALPAPLRDLIHIAAFVLAADCATSRGTLTAVDNGASWRRDFHFVVPVSDPDRWSQPALRRALETTLGFLSDETFHFEFVPVVDQSRGGQIRFQPAGDGRTFTSWKQVDDVLLFSGGMDSFSGAVDACIRDGRHPLLVSHRSSTKMRKVQRELVNALRRRTGGTSPWYLAIDVHRHTRELHQEESQRTRSFLFSAIAGAVSWLAEQNRLRFHENGVIALNLPISAQLQGARGTRTVHPRVLDGFARILGLVADQPFVVDNPYQWMTRADVATRIGDAGVRELLRGTRSCASVRGATNMHPFCGVCSQCVDRQFAVRAAGLLQDDPEEMYAVRLFDAALEVDRDVQLAVGYVSTARVFAGLSGRQELVSRFGEALDASPELARQWSITAEQALDRVVDLYKRQGQMVLDVVAGELAARSTPLIGGTLHPASLLARCVESGLSDARRAYGLEGQSPAQEGTPPVPPPEKPADDGTSRVPGPSATAVDPVALLMPKGLLPSDMFVDVGHGWLVGLAGTRGVIVRASTGMPLLRTLLQHPHRDFPVLDLEAGTKGCDPAATDEGKRRGQKQDAGTPTSTTPGSFVKLDDTAISKIRARIAELRDDEAEGEENTDTRGALAARDEREALEDQLQRDLGLGGSAVEVAPEVQRARSRVSKAINRALKDIVDAGHLGLKRHLGNTVKMGFSFQYRPEDPRSWVTTT